MISAGSSDERYYSLLNARPGEDGKRLKNIRIVGEGSIDGNGWKKDENGNDFYRKQAKKGEPLPANHVSNIGILAANQIAALEKNKGLDENKAYPRRSRLFTVTMAMVLNLFMARALKCITMSSIMECSFTIDVRPPLYKKRLSP